MSSKRDWALAIKIVRSHSSNAERYLKDGSSREFAYDATMRATVLTKAFIYVFSTNKKFDEQKFRDACRITV